MARLNTRLSYRSSLRANTATPAPEGQENRDPSLAHETAQSKEYMADTRRDTSLPTPSSEATPRMQSQKRKRTELALECATPATDATYDDDEENEDERLTRYYDPNQDADERRGVKKRFRTLERHFQENRDELLREVNGEGLNNTLDRANRFFNRVKQTNDATVDSRLLVSVSDIAYKKTAQLVLGDTSAVIDVDEFLSKCITFMRGDFQASQTEDGAPSTPRRQSNTHRHRTPGEYDDGVDEIEDELDWQLLGRYACYPYNARPAVPSFLLGPLSVEKKRRKETQRRARNTRDTAARESRPEEISKDSLQQSDEGGLAAICTRLLSMLKRRIAATEKAIETAGITSSEELQTPEGKALLRQHKFTDAGGVSLFHFALNPNSFGQSVENLFYISFLIRENSLGITLDSNGLPTIIVANEQSLEEKRRSDARKHQAVFSLDYATWKDLVDALEIDIPLIPHRDEDEAALHIPQTGWYT